MKTPAAKFTKYALDNGITLLTENIPYLRTVTIGLWLPFGSSCEKRNFYGSSHFIEHMLFKGTKNRNGNEIGQSIESVGGMISGFTGKEITCFHAKSLCEHLPLLLDVLSDMFLNSIFDHTKFNNEKKVIIEEIKSIEDSPEEFIYDLFLEDIFGDKGLGHKILGEVSTIENLSRDNLYEIYKTTYTPQNLIVAIAGNLNNTNIPKTVKKHLGENNVKSKQNKNKKSKNKQNCLYQPIEQKYTKGINPHYKKSEQIHFYFGTPGVHYQHPDKYTYGVLDLLLSGGISSRLFQEIREKRGLVYDISSEHIFFKNTGLFSISGSTSPKNLLQVIKLMMLEINKIKNGEITDAELSKVKEQSRSFIAMSLESVTSRMMKIARSEIYYGRNIDDDEILDEIKQVTKDDIVKIANSILTDNKKNFSFLGEVKNEAKTIENIRKILENS